MGKLWKDARPLVLASRSAARRAVLEDAGLDILCEDAGLDERAWSAREGLDDATPERLASSLARAKALLVSSRQPDHWVVGADQTLALDGEVLHKPATLRDAAAQLRRLSGRAHRLSSAVCCARAGEARHEFVSVATLHVRPLGDAFLDAYLTAAGADVRTSVGAYQLEKLGVHLFERIEGDQTTIMGMPMLPLLAFFRAAGAVEA